MIIDRSCSSLAQPEHGDGGPVNQNDERYDDGGFSEGTMERPGLKRLLLRAAVMAAHDIGITVLARQRNQCRHRLTKLIRLSWLSPRIVTMILAGDSRHHSRLHVAEPGTAAAMVRAGGHNRGISSASRQSPTRCPPQPGGFMRCGRPPSALMQTGKRPSETGGVFAHMFGAPGVSRLHRPKRASQSAQKRATLRPRQGNYVIIPIG